MESHLSDAHTTGRTLSSLSVLWSRRARATHGDAPEAKKSNHSKGILAFLSATRIKANDDRQKREKCATRLRKYLILALSNAEIILLAETFSQLESLIARWVFRTFFRRLITPFEWVWASFSRKLNWGQER
jgi:hypothetical protein